MLQLVPGGFLKVVDGDVTVIGTGKFGSLVVGTNTLIANVTGYVGKVGIRTLTPDSILHLVHDDPGDIIGLHLDARDSGITTRPVFTVRLPVAAANAFQMHRGDDVWAWASFEYSADNDDTMGKPGFVLGTGAGARDTNLFREAANKLRTNDNVVVDGWLGIGTIGLTAKLDINSDILRLRTAKTPATAGADGYAGSICWDADYIYVCVAANTWERAALASW